MSHQTKVLECFAWFKLCNSDFIASSSFGALQIFIIIWSLKRNIFGGGCWWQVLVTSVSDNKVSVTTWSYLEPLNFWLFIGRAPNCLIKFSHRPWRFNARSVEIKSRSKRLSPEKFWWRDRFLCFRNRWKFSSPKNIRHQTWKFLPLACAIARVAIIAINIPLNNILN